MAIQVSIKNYQAVQDVSFTIKGLTVLVGDNDIGKSSTFRALNAALRNKAGDAFITHGRSSAQVLLQGPDFSVQWDKPKKSGSTYIVNSETYEKVGVGTPDFIKDTGLGEIELKSTDLDPHFSKQGDLPFLVFNTSAVLTEFFSELLSFGPLGKAQAVSNKDLKSNAMQIRVCNKEISRVEKTLEVFKDGEHLYTDAENISSQYSKYKVLGSTLADIKVYRELSNLVSGLVIPDLNEVTQALTKLKTLRVVVKDLHALKILTAESRFVLKEDTTSEQITKIRKLSVVVDQIKIFRDLVRKTDIEIPTTENLSALNNEIKFTQLSLQELKSFKEYDKSRLIKIPATLDYTVILDRISLLRLSLEIQEISAKLESKELELVSTKQELDTALKEKGYCPTCKRTV